MCGGWFCVRSGLAAAASAPLSLLIFLWDPSPRAVFAFAPPWSGDHHPSRSCSAGLSCPHWLVWVRIGLVLTTGGRGCRPGMLTAPPAWVQLLRSVPGSPVIAQRGWPLGGPSFKGIGSKRRHCGDSATCLLSCEPSGAGRGSPFWVLPPPHAGLGHRAEGALVLQHHCSAGCQPWSAYPSPLPAWLLWHRPRGPLSFQVSGCSFCPPAGSPSSSCPSRVGFRGLLPWCPSRAASLPKPVRWEHLPRPLGACCLSHTPHALRPPHPVPTLLCHLDHGHSL